MVTSCVIATIPWSGARMLCQALRDTGQAGDPRDYFDPLKVPARSRKWGLARCPEAEFAPRYLSAVAAAATGSNGVLSVNLPWSHQRWLVRFARATVPVAYGERVPSDAAIVSAWYPHTRYLYLTSADASAQAVRWYQNRRGNPGPGPGGPPDPAALRWIEDLIARQEQAWENYFQVHELDVRRITFETLAGNQEETVRGILSWLETPGRGEN